MHGKANTRQTDPQYYIVHRNFTKTRKKVINLTSYYNGLWILIRSKTLACKSILNTVSLQLSSPAMHSSSSSSLSSTVAAVLGATFLAAGATPSLASHLCADAVRATASHHVQQRHSNRGSAPQEDDRRCLCHGHGRLRHRADHLGVRRARRGAPRRRVPHRGGEAVQLLLCPPVRARRRGHHRVVPAPGAPRASAMPCLAASSAGPNEPYALARTRRPLSVQWPSAPRRAAASRACRRARRWRPPGARGRGRRRRRRRRRCRSRRTMPLARACWRRGTRAPGGTGSLADRAASSPYSQGLSVKCILLSF